MEQLSLMGGISDNELKTYLKEIEDKEKLVITADGKITSERLNKILLILTKILKDNSTNECK